MCETLAEVRSAMEALGSQLDARTATISTASRRLEDAIAIQHMAAAIAADHAARVSEGDDWRRNGAKSAAEDIAKRTGTSVGSAIETLKTAERLQDLPEVAEAAKRGELSPQQTKAVAEAAAVAPTEEQRLVELAGKVPLRELQDECGRTKAAHTDAEANRRRIHAGRSLRTWDDKAGTGQLHAKGPAHVIAAMAARIQVERDRIFKEHRRDGEHESPDAYAFDALEQLLCGDAPSAAAPDYKLIIRFDIPTLFRGYPIDGETCDVAGSPVAVSVIEELLTRANPFITAVITNGEAITGVVHLGRQPTAKQQTALEWLYPTCAAEGCSQSARLQRDHREDWADTHVTIFDLLDLLCAHHHGLKTRENWRLVEGTGKRAFVPPDDPRRPQHAPPSAA